MVPILSNTVTSKPTLLDLGTDPLPSAHDGKRIGTESSYMYSNV